MSDTIKTAEVGGVQFDYDEAMLDDVRTVYAIGKLSDDKVDDSNKMMWYTRLMDLVMVDPYETMNGLAEAGDGKLDVEKFNDFFTKALEAMQAKN